MRHPKRGRERFDNLDRRVARGAFQITDIGAVHARLVSKSLLAERSCLTEAAQVCRKAVLDVHAPRQARLSTINLQTMSDIVPTVR